jgi:hypothetical protein
VYLWQQSEQSSKKTIRAINHGWNGKCFDGMLLSWHVLWSTHRPHHDKYEYLFLDLPTKYSYLLPKEKKPKAKEESPPSSPFGT